MASRLARLHTGHTHHLHLLFFPSPAASATLSRRAAMSGVARGTFPHTQPTLPDSPPALLPNASIPSDAAAPQVAARPPRAPQPEKPKPQLRATKAALTVTPRAVQRLRSLLSGPAPQLIRIGVKNKGCAGMAYHLEYVDKPGRFDEVVEQDGVKVLIDSKALFSIIGSEMDWLEDRLSSKFAFKNPNIKDACGCGESFNVG